MFVYFTFESSVNRLNLSKAACSIILTIQVKIQRYFEKLFVRARVTTLACFIARHQGKTIEHHAIDNYAGKQLS